MMYSIIKFPRSEKCVRLTAWSPTGTLSTGDWRMEVNVGTSRVCSGDTQTGFLHNSLKISSTILITRGSEMKS